MRIGDKVIFRGKNATIYDISTYSDKIWVENDEDMYIATSSDIISYVEFKKDEICRILENEGYIVDEICQDYIEDVEFITVSVETSDYIVYIDMNSNDSYDLCTYNKNLTSKELDEDEDMYKNRRSVKSTKAVKNYVERFDK